MSKKVISKDKKDMCPVGVVSCESEYRIWLSSLEQNIKSAQVKAALSVNSEMIKLYWLIGRDIHNLKFEFLHGAQFFRRLSFDLRSEFPNATGFSERNLRYMQKFYMFYSGKILHQAGAEIEQMLFSIPWRHHIEIMTRAKSVDEGLFFVAKTLENGWSRAVLINMMSTNLFETRGCVVNNFAITMSKPDCDIAKGFAFMRYFYRYQRPGSSDELMKQYLEIEERVNESEEVVLEIRFEVGEDV